MAVVVRRFQLVLKCYLGRIQLHQFEYCPTENVSLDLEAKKRCVYGLTMHSSMFMFMFICACYHPLVVDTHAHSGISGFHLFYEGAHFF